MLILILIWMLSLGRNHFIKLIAMLSQFRGVESERAMLKIIRLLLLLLLLYQTSNADEENCEKVSISTLFLKCFLSHLSSNFSFTMSGKIKLKPFDFLQNVQAHFHICVCIHIYMQYAYICSWIPGHPSRLGNLNYEVVHLVWWDPGVYLLFRFYENQPILPMYL